ncbi:CCA tRNA nucleotidyltransferase [Paenibacillus alkalitolerans]|uniref:CCA tRNA nucleotidyltransferase n=1 Tax=Paenibacillus alkalitolerans TaxID=2799335 RepID=UPI0018F7522B|nr:CCA tRNA nucleotidyltransferase [Paenibacillus alkalitolerans]
MSNPFARLFQTELGKAGLEVLRRLNRAGYAAYFVGGCVRDSVLGRALKDVDIASSATPGQVLELYPDAIPTGLQHGTVTVRSGGFTFEVTTFRAESEYTDGRRPDTVSFIDSIEGDLERRDFTMNAMALSVDGTLIDPYGGSEDLERKVLRCVGDPALRFGEDALRMLRCVRFAAEYKLTVDERTWREALAGAPGLSRIAMERVRMELERMMSGADPYRAVRLLAESELLRWTKTRLRFPRQLGVVDSDADPLTELPRLPDTIQRWALWLHRMGLSASEASGAVSSLRGSRAFAEDAQKLIGLHDTLSTVPAQHAESAWKTAVVGFAKETAVRWLPIASALQAYDGYRWTSPYAEHGCRWLEEMGVTALSELAVDGRTLMEALNKKGGPWLSHLLKRLLFEASLNRVPNESGALIARAREMAEEGDSQQ